jgi:hypothetical protein
MRAMTFPTPGHTCFNKMSWVFMVSSQAHPLLVGNPPTPPLLKHWPTLKDASINAWIRVNGDSEALRCSVYGADTTWELCNVIKAVWVIRLWHESSLKQPVRIGCKQRSHGLKGDFLTGAVLCSWQPSGVQLDGAHNSPRQLSSAMKTE